MATPNSRVSRTVKVQADASALASLMERVAMDTPAVPIRLLFEPEGVSCWTLNAGKTVMLMLTRWPVTGLKVKEPCVLVCDPKETAAVIRTKGRGGAIRLSAEPSDAIAITTQEHGGAEVMPADEDDCLTVPDRNRIPHNDEGIPLFPMFDSEPATWTATMPLTSLREAHAEMTVTKAPYVVLTLKEGSDPSEARSGHWSGKQTRSWTPIEATTPKTFTVAFTDVLHTIISRFSNETTMVRVSKHEKGSFVVIEATDGPDTMLVATEAIREA